MASVTDNFNRASLGSNWTVDAGGFAIISSTYVAADTAAAVPRMRYTGTAMDSANHSVDFDRQSPSGSDKKSGPTARQASSTQTCYAARYEGEWSGSDGWELLKYVSGTETVLDSATPLGWGNSVALHLEVDGTSISATLDAANGLSATDSAISSGTYAGLMGQWQDSCQGDNFAAADLAAGGGPSISGALTASAATISGALVRDVQMSGVLASGPASLTGALKRAAIMSGALVAGPASVSGTLTQAIDITGAVQAGPASLTGSLLRTAKLSGALQAGPATTTGAIGLRRSVSGALQAGPATTSGYMFIGGGSSNASFAGASVKVVGRRVLLP